ncbi:hypothetical protein KP509_37G043100 [Ceratopteris richardii]|uniref:Reverse transcriptase zinc-binding domain-containing protein n=1 Tax=Ceratopteris richardii TaxID=49495 RepID=A0A8T2Q8D8_CERRI|nr:hypothetical protein KP509_37G043100 [Ceratopteris richardii]
MMMDKIVWITLKLSCFRDYRPLTIHKVVEEIYMSYKKNYSSIGSIVPRLNKKWKVCWSTGRWKYRFKLLWAFPSSAKQSILLWLILHQALWNGSRAKKFNISNSLNTMCGKGEELEHMFAHYPSSTRFWITLQTYYSCYGLPPLSSGHVLVGTNNKLDDDYGKSSDLMSFGTYGNKGLMLSFHLPTWTIYFNVIRDYNVLSRTLSLS